MTLYRVGNILETSVERHRTLCLIIKALRKVGIFENNLHIWKWLNKVSVLANFEDDRLWATFRHSKGPPFW